MDTHPPTPEADAAAAEARGLLRRADWMWLSSVAAGFALLAILCCGVLSLPG